MRSRRGGLVGNIWGPECGASNPNPTSRVVIRRNTSPLVNSAESFYDIACKATLDSKSMVRDVKREE